MTQMLRIGQRNTKTNLVRGKTFSYLPIGDLPMNTQQLIFTRQQANATQKFFTEKVERS